jgi:hypothetical protein
VCNRPAAPVGLRLSGSPAACFDERVTSGYSATPQARKLGLRPGTRLAVLGAPAGWALDDPPPVDPVAPESDDPADVLIVFVRQAAELAAVVDRAGRIFPAGALWVAWPRKVSGHVSDVDENGIRAAVLPHGLVDVKVAAIDEDWSGLKIVWRKERRG